MSNLREAAQQALEALENVTRHFTRVPSTLKDSEFRGESHKSITALRAALAEEALQRLTDVSQDIEAELAEPEQEPVAWWHRKSDTFTSGNLISNFDEWTPLYNAPPQQQSDPLIEEQRLDIVATALRGHASTRDAIQWAIEAVERHHGIRGGA